MSADNVIYIAKIGFKWYVMENGCASINYIMSDFKKQAKAFKSKRDALVYAFDLECNGYYEYGICHYEFG